MITFTELENDIDSFHTSNNIFSQPLARYIQKLLWVTETYIKKIRNTAISIEGVAEKEFFRKLGYHLSGVEQAMCWGIQLCKRTVTDTPNISVSPDEYDSFIALILLGNKYSVLTDEFTKNHKKQNLYEFIDENTLRFYYPDELHPYVQLGILHSIKRNANSHVNFASGYDKLKGQRAVEVIFSRRYMQNKRFALHDADFSIAIKPFVEQATSWWKDKNSIPEDWVFDKISVLDFKYFCIAVFALTLLELTVAYSDTPPYSEYIYPPVYKMTEINLIKEIHKIYPHLDRAIISYALNLLTYKPNSDVKIDSVSFCTTPFIKIEDFFLTTPHIFARLEAGDALMYHIDRSDEKFAKIANEKEAIQFSDFRDKFKKMDGLICISNVKLPSPWPDIDLLVYSYKTQSILAVELKWFSGVLTTGKQCNKINNDVIHAIEQMKSIYDYFDEDMQGKLNNLLNNRLPSNIKLNTIQKMAYIVIVNGIPDSYSNRLPVLSTETVNRIFDEADSFENFLYRIVSGRFLTESNYRLMLSYNSIRYSKYTFEVPLYIPRYRVGRNDLCPCGSKYLQGKRKKYKDCCLLREEIFYKARM